MGTRLHHRLLLVAALGAWVVTVPITLPLTASELSLEVRLEPQQEVGVEDTVQLSVTIWGAGKGAVLELGELGNLQVIAGPFNQYQHSLVNGVSSVATRYTYPLRPRQIGPASLGPVEVTVGETTLPSEVMTIEVKPGSLLPQRQERRQPLHGISLSRGPGPAGPDLREARVVLRHLMDNQSPFLGEPVTVSLVLDTNISRVESFEMISPPAYPGMWSQSIKQKPGAGQPVEVDGFRYYRVVLASHVLIPLTSGELILPPVKARFWVRGRGIFSPGQRLERTTETLRVQVRERPGDPGSFAGGVGRLSYRAELQPPTITLGSSAVLTIELSGSGNLPLMTAPDLWPSCSGYEIYPPEEDSAVEIGTGGIHGTRTWRTTLVPRQSGELHLDPITISTFDPGTGHYQEQSIGELSLQVVPPPPDESAPAQEPQPRPAVSGQAQGAPTGVPMLWFAAALVLGVAAGGISTWLLARRRAEEPDRCAHTGLQAPSERARELQGQLAGWWHEHGEQHPALREEMEQLRGALEAVRFAPGRADHTYTVVDLEQRLKRLMRQS